MFCGHVLLGLQGIFFDVVLELQHGPWVCVELGDQGPGHTDTERERVSETISCANTHQIFNLFNGSIHIYIYMHNYNVFQCIAGSLVGGFRYFSCFAIIQ